MNFVSKTRNCVSKTRNFVLKNDEFCSEAHNAIRKRDAAELKCTLSTITPEQWDSRVRAQDNVLTSHWGHFEGGAKAKLKRSWLVLADVISVEPTRYSGWLEMSMAQPITVSCTFIEAGSLGLAFADPEGRATIKQVKPGTTLHSKS